jgi:hypothetical protein
MTDNVQLGTLRLDLFSGPSTPSDWVQLSIETLATLAEAVLDASKDLLRTIRYLLNDSGLGFQATYRRHQTGLTIRASILPSDARDSTWKRIGGRGAIKERANHLRKLFWHLRSGWDGEGDYLMTRTVRRYISYSRWANDLGGRSAKDAGAVHGDPISPRAQL